MPHTAGIKLPNTPRSLCVAVHTVAGPIRSRTRTSSDRREEGLVNQLVSRVLEPASPSFPPDLRDFQNEAVPRQAAIPAGSAASNRFCRGLCFPETAGVTVMGAAKRLRAPYSTDSLSPYVRWRTERAEADLDNSAIPDSCPANSLPPTLLLAGFGPRALCVRGFFLCAGHATGSLRPLTLSASAHSAIRRRRGQ